MKRIQRTCLTGLLILTVACGINRQLDQAKALENCTYDLLSADSITVAGVDVSKLKNMNTFDLAQMPGLALAFLRQDIPLKGRVNLRISNPSNTMAGINQFEYKVLIKGQELANGFVDQKINVAPGGGSTIVPIRVNANIYSLLSDGKTLKAITDFISSGNTSSGTEKTGVITIKIKPTLDLGGKQVQYPGYITIDKEISSKILL